MTEERRDLDDTFDLPMQPTGSGVADLETARELDALAAASPASRSDENTVVDAVELTPKPADDDLEESEARPS